MLTQLKIYRWGKDDLGGGEVEVVRVLDIFVRVYVIVIEESIHSHWLDWDVAVE